MSKAQVLEELLEGHEISEFSLRWVLTSRTSEEEMRETYNLLRKLGVSDEKIALQAYLLGNNPETIERNYQHLSLF